MNDRTAPSKLLLTQGAASLFFFSFLMSGCNNALPQLFFQRHAPELKTQLLSLALLASTLAAIAGVRWSHAIRARQIQVVSQILATIALTGLLFMASTVWLFMVCLVLLQFSNNFLLNQVDSLAAASAGHLRTFYDGLANAARLAGMLCAPLFFTAFATSGKVEWVVTALVAGVAVIGAIPLFRRRPPVPVADFPGTGDDAGKRKDAGNETALPDRGDHLLFAYTVTVYAALYLCAANMIYLLRDFLHLASAETRGGTAIVTVFLGALATNGMLGAAHGAFSGSRSGSYLPTVAFVLPAVVMLFAAGLMLSGLRAGFPVVLSVAGAIGVAFGTFLWAWRDYASRAAKQGRTAIIAWYNNGANIGSLIAFCLMLALTHIRSGTVGDYYNWLLGAVMLLQAIGLMLFFRSGASTARGADTVRAATL